MTIVNAAILGIDYGSDFMVVSIIRPGAPVEAALDFNSKRKTPTAILFEDSATTFGYDAVGAGARKPHNVLNHFSRFIAQGTQSEYVGYFKDLAYPFEFVPNNRSTLDVKFPENTGFKDIETLSSEEVSALLLEYAKTIGEHADDGKEIKDVAIAVPAFWTHHQRMAIKNAARLAGLNVLTLIDYPTSAALQYSINKIFPNSTQKVMFYDMGGSSTHVVIAEYSTKVIPKQVPKRYFRILSKTWDEFLGGNNIDIELMNYFINDFEKKTNLDVSNQYKVLHKFRTLATKYKEVMTVNERIPVHEGSIYQEKDYSLLLERKTLNSLIEKDIVDRIAAPALQALQDAGLTSGDLYGVEIIGGGVRVPLIQNILKKALHKETLDTHMNGDETVAFGAAFRAANLSRAFKTRFIGMTDYNPYSVKLHLYRNNDDESFNEEEEEPRNQDFIYNKGEEGYTIDLFKKGSNYKSQKTVGFHAYKDFYVHVYYNDSTQLSKGNPTTIYRYKVSGVKEALNSVNNRIGSPNITMIYVNDADGTIYVRDAFMKIRYEGQEEIEIDVPLSEQTVDNNNTTASDNNDTTTATTSDNDTTTATTPESDTVSDDAETPADNTETPSEDTETPAENTTETSEKPKGEENNSTETDTDNEEKKKEEKPKTMKKKIMVNKKKIRKIRLTLTPVYLDNEEYIYQLNDDEFKASQEKLKYIRRMNEKKREHGKAVNDFEGYIYYAQQRITEDDYISHSQEGEIQEIETLLSSMDDWFAEEADDTTPTKVYKDKYLEMKSAVEVVENRIAEEKAKIEKERKEKEEAERKKKEEEEKKKKEEEDKKKKEEETKKEDNEKSSSEENTTATEVKMEKADEESKNTNSATEDDKETEEFKNMSEAEQKTYFDNKLKDLKKRYREEMSKEGKEFNEKEFDDIFNNIKLKKNPNLKKEEPEL
ncbi:hypothetical protein WA158_000045 [Blastocystis sp. Blastoise]